VHSPDTGGFLEREFTDWRDFSSTHPISNPSFPFKSLLTPGIRDSVLQFVHVANRQRVNRFRLTEGGSIMNSRVKETKMIGWAPLLVTFLSAMIVLVPVAQSADEQTSGSVAAASAYPNRPIVLVAPFPPGHATDIENRKIAPLLAEALDNRSPSRIGPEKTVLPLWRRWRKRLLTATR